MNDQNIMSGQEAWAILTIDKKIDHNDMDYDAVAKLAESIQPDKVSEKEFWNELKSMLKTGCEMQAERRQASKNEREYIAEHHPEIHGVLLIEDPYFNSESIRIEAELQDHTFAIKDLVSGHINSRPLWLFGDISPEIDPKSIIIADNLKDGETLQAATGWPVFVPPYQENGLQATVETIKKELPQSKITICAINQCTPNPYAPDRKPALQEALDVAKSAGVKVAIPAFNRQELADGLATFSQLHAVREKQAQGKGEKAVKESSQNLLVDYSNKFRFPRSQASLLKEAQKPRTTGLSR